MTRPRIRSGLVAAAIGAAATLLVVACQAVPAATAPTAQSRLAHTVELHATEFSYAVPAPLPAGLVTLQTTNDGDEPHHVQLLRLNSGVTYERFATALQAEGEAAVRLTTAAGGVGLIDPRRTAEVTLNLEAGTYVLACFIPSPDGVPHLAKGMLMPIQVSPVSRGADGRGTGSAGDDQDG